MQPWTTSHILPTVPTLSLAQMGLLMAQANLQPGGSKAVIRSDPTHLYFSLILEK